MEMRGDGFDRCDCVLIHPNTCAHLFYGLGELTGVDRMTTAIATLRGGDVPAHFFGSVDELLAFPIKTKISNYRPVPTPVAAPQIS
jgi:hypothetical protein